MIGEKKQKELLENLKQYCIDRGGTLLTTKYHGVIYKYPVLCKNNHNFTIKLNYARDHKIWCKKCNNENYNKDSINKIQEIELKRKIKKEEEKEELIKKEKDKILNQKKMKEIYDYCNLKKGICLETEYKGYYNKYLCMCEKGHKFNLSWGNAKLKRTWCHICGGCAVNPIIEMKKIHEYCKDRSGKCLEDIYHYANSKYKCQCKRNHTFNLNWKLAKKRGDWCSECNFDRHRGQRLVKEIIEKLTNKTFVSEKSFASLKSPKNKKLRYDLFCKELNLLIEYNGEQHYREMPFFHSGETKFEYQQYKDKLKRQWAADNGYKFIEIKYILNLNKDNVQEVLIDLLKTNNMEISNN